MYWREDDHGENCISWLLIFQFFIFLGCSGVNIAAGKLSDDGTVPQVVIYEIVVCTWFYFAAFYFLWHSLKRAIILELVSYVIVMVLLAIGVAWR